MGRNPKSLGFVAGVVKGPAFNRDRRLTGTGVASCRNMIMTSPNYNMMMPPPWDI